MINSLKFPRGRAKRIHFAILSLIERLFLRSSSMVAGPGINRSPGFRPVGRLKIYSVLNMIKQGISLLRCSGIIPTCGMHILA